ncbi:MAG: sulfotransferase [Gammaproteobacteria bacterium]|nr:sulfotransferase [Gammaproteobacteria bacterium]
MNSREFTDNTQVLSRIFLVGCSRSGTTLVQRTLTERYQLYTLPETDFFGLLVGGGLGALACRLGISRSRKVYWRAFDRLTRLLPADAASETEQHSWRLRPLIDRFVEILDRKALDAEESGWLEKTPKHFRHTGLIHRCIPGAQIIHVVRQGSEVTASIRDRANRFPEQFGRQHNPEYAVKLWNRSVRTALTDAKRGRALVIMYEDFVDNHEKLVRMIGEQLHLKQRQQNMETVPRIIDSAEQWKSNSLEEIRPATSKFTEVFDSDTRTFILKNLDTRAYEALAPLALSVSRQSDC